MVRKRVVSYSESETAQLGAELVAGGPSDLVVLLDGDLGSGKTVWVRGMAVALGIDAREVQSPTYTLIHEHEGLHGRLIHVDLYRLEGSEIGSLGLEETLAGAGIKAIEWAERLDDAGIMLQRSVRVRFHRTTGGEREILIEAPDPWPMDSIGENRRSH